MLLEHMQLKLLEHSLQMLLVLQILLVELQLLLLLLERFLLLV
jgi:hypothetical protein